MAVVPRYYRRVLVRFSWGTADGQLGVARQEERIEELPVPGAPPAPAPAATARRLAREEDSGPDKMVVDGRGNAFIHDPINRRTLLWDAKARVVRTFRAPFPFSRACCFDGTHAWVLVDTPGVVGRVEKTNLATGASELIEFDQSNGVYLYDGIDIDQYGVVVLESPRNGKVVRVDPHARKVALEVDGEEVPVLPAEVEPLRREGQGDASPAIPWSVDDPPLALYSGGMTIVSGDQVKVDGRGRVYLRLVKAREGVFHREFLQCYAPMGEFLWEAPLDRSENLYPALEKGALVDVDRGGDVYQLVIRSQGAELVYWDWGWGR